MKKILIVLGVIFGTFVLAAVLVPIFVDVDKYRPEIVQKAEEHLNGKLVLGKLKLSLWGQISINIDGVDLKDLAGTSIVKVQSAYFHVPFSSVLSGSPLLTLRMDRPEVNIVKAKSGKLNAMTLIKESAPGEIPATAPSSSGKASLALPALAVNARLGVELRQAQIRYRDESNGLKNELNDLNIILKDLSLSRATEMEIWADLKTVFGKSLSVRGPFKVSGRLKPQIASGKLEKISGQFKVDLDSLDIEVPGSFHKSKGIPMHLETQFSGTETDAKLDQFVVRFHNAEIHVTGDVRSLPNPTVDLRIKSNDIALAPWVELMPSLKGYELGGKVTLDAGATGPASSLKYFANLQAHAVTAKAPKLKGKPVFNARIEIITDQIRDMRFDFKAPGADIQGQGKMISFSRPQLKMAITSKGINLDEMLDLPPPTKSAEPVAEIAPKAKVGGNAGGASGADGKAGADYDEMVAPLRGNAIARATQVDITFQSPLIQSYGAKVQNISTHFTMRDLGMMLESSFQLWNSRSSGKMAVDFKKDRPIYNMNFEMKGLDLKEAVTSQYELFKNTAYGTLSFKMQGAGQSFNPDLAIDRLSARGNFRVDQATFASIDVGKMVQEGINGALNKVGDKVPGLKGKQLSGLNQGQSKYEFISADFSIAGGTFRMPNFVAKAQANQGIDLTGSTDVGLKDYALTAKWKVMDTYNMTHARDVGVEVDGTKIPSILAHGSEPVGFPVTVGCFAKSPCFNYGEVPEHFGKIALENVALAVRSRVEGEAKKKAGEAVRQAIPNAPPAVKDALKRFGF